MIGPSQAMEAEEEKLWQKQMEAAFEEADRARETFRKTFEVACSSEG